MKNAGRLFSAAAVAGGAALGMGASPYSATPAGVDAAKADADAARTKSDEVNAALGAAQKKAGETARAEEAERVLKDRQGGMKPPFDDERSIDKLKADLAATEKAIAELTEILNSGDAMIERTYRAFEAASAKAAASKEKLDEVLRKLGVARRSWSDAEADYKDKERAHNSLVSQHRAYADAQERARRAKAAYDRARADTEAAKRALEDARVAAQRTSAAATDALDAYAKVLAEFSMKQSDEQRTPDVQKKVDEQRTPDTQKKVGKHSAERIAARHASQTEGASGNAKASDAAAGSERQSTMAVTRNDMGRNMVRSAGSVSGGTMRASASLPQTGYEAGGSALAAALEPRPSPRLQQAVSAGACARATDKNPTESNAGASSAPAFFVSGYLQAMVLIDQLYSYLIYRYCQSKLYLKHTS